MKLKIKFFMPAISLVIGISMYANTSKTTIALGAEFSNGPIQCNTETPVPLISGTFDGLSASYSTTGGCSLGCGVSNASRLVDTNTSNYATATTLLGIGVTHRLRVTDSNDIFAAGSFAGFRIAPNGGILSVDLLNNISIKTYLAGSVRETVSGNSLINLSLLSSSGNFILGFNTNQTFDAVEISISSLVGVSTSTNIYYAVIRNYCAGSALVCNTPTALNLPTFPAAVETNHTGLSGVSIGSISNPENAISSNTSDFAALNLSAGAIGSISLSIKDEITDYPSGTYAGFDVENINLLTASAISNVMVKTYLNGSYQEQFSGTNLLVNGTLLSATGRSKLGFASNLPFDEVQISINQVVGVNLGITKIYSAVFEKFCAGPDLICNTQTTINSPSYPVFIDSSNTGIDGLVCALCSVTNTDNLIDSNANNYANIDLTTSVGTIAKIAVKDQITDYPIGTFAGFDIENVALLNANVFDAITVTTFLNGSKQEIKSGNDALISLNTFLLNGTPRVTVGFVSTKPFDEVQISLTNLATVTLGTVKVYNAIFEKLCTPTVECNKTYALTNPAFPVTIDSTKSGIKGAVCAACAINNPNNVLTASISDFANISVVAGVIASGSIAVTDQLFTYPAGTFAGFTIKDINNLIEADLFQSLTILTYNNGNLQETKTGAQLISLSLVVPILGSGPGFYNVGFKTILPFDEIRISVGSLASVVSNLNVYGAFVNTKDSDGSGIGSLNCLASDLSVLKTSSNSTPSVGSNITFTILAANAGPHDADGVVVNDILPSGYTYISSATSVGTYNNTSGIWTIGNLSAGSNATLTITAKVNISGIYANTATITGNQPDPNQNNNKSTSTPIPVNVIDAVNDSGSTTSSGGTAVTNVLGNDTLNGQPVITSQVNTSFVSSTNSGITLSGTSVVVAAGTPAGNYTLTYQICEKINPTNCDQATVSVTVSAAPIDAVNDSGSANGFTGGTAVANVLANDTLNNQPVNASQVNTTFISSSNSGITLSGTSVVVAAGTPAGNYTLTYQICEKLNPSNCDQANVSVTVTKPVIDAVNDSGSTTSSGGTAVTNVLGNDTLNGQPVIVSQVNTTFVSSTNSGITLSGTSVIVASGTPAGNYTLIYQICEKVNPTNCDQANASVTVSNAVIDAVNDSGSTTSSGGTAVTNVLGNDTLNGQPVIASQVNTSFVSSTNSGITLSGTSVVVASGTPAGNYSLTYQICEKLNPSNCDQANVSITVTKPVIDAVNDSGSTTSSGGTVITNVLANDILNNQPVNASQVNTTFVSSTNSGITLSGTSVVVASGTPAGNYTLIYQICEKVNPTNCDQANVFVTVTCSQIASPTITITQPTCVSPTGIITVTSPTGTGLTYSVDGSNYQSNTTFFNLSPKSYNVTAKNSGGCVSSATTAVINGQPSTCSTAGIFHTSVTCTDYKNDSGSQLVGQLCYTAKSNKVSNVTPGQFFYFATIIAPSASFCVDIVETKSCTGLALFAIQQSNQITLYNSNCSSVASGTQTSLGVGNVCISNATPGAQYVLSVKYDSKSVVGSTFSGTPPDCQYNFESRINGTTVVGSTTSILMSQNCSSTARIATTIEQPEFNVMVSPNPSKYNFVLNIDSLSDDNIKIRVIDINGRIIHEMETSSHQNIYFGDDLSSGLYFIEVIQGNERKVLKAQKM